MEIENKLPKGSFALAHIQSSGYSLLAGTFHYSCYFVVQVTKATREGQVKEFIVSANGTPKRVDRKTTIYAYPAQYSGTEQEMFSRQEVCGSGYQDKAELKAALESASSKIAA